MRKANIKKKDIYLINVYLFKKLKILQLSLKKKSFIF